MDNVETDVYTGTKKWFPSEQEELEFFSTKTLPFELLENEYLIICGEEYPSPLYFKQKNGKLKEVHPTSIKTYIDNDEDEMETYYDPKAKKPKKKFAKGKSLTLSPRNDEQVCAFDLAKDPDTTIKLFLGTWGAGKDLIMANAALEALRYNKFERIIWIRNPITLKDCPDLGALPGEVLDKLLPYLGPFIDAVGKSSVRTMLQKETLVVEPLQTLRGRNFENSIIICSEAENLTYDQLKLIVARVAEGSCLMINGDIRQRDRAVFERSKGLEKFIECLKGEELFGYVFLPKTERSETAKLADKLDRFDTML